MAYASIAKSKYKRNDLTAEYVRSILDYDPKTGIFRWKYRNNAPQAVNTRWAGMVAGRKASNGYWDISINYKRYQSHRLAWLYMTGEWPKEEIDHKDLGKANNKWQNLRQATHGENSRNVRKKINNTSGYKGVRLFSLRNYRAYQARITVNGKVFYLGYFNSAEKAYVAYCKAAKKYHGNFKKIK